MTTTLIPIRVWIVWTALIAATVASAWLGNDHGPRRVASVFVLLVAFGKVALVAEHFMGSRRAPLALRLLLVGWVAVLASTLVALYLTSD